MSYCRIYASRVEVQTDSIATSNKAVRDQSNNPVPIPLAEKEGDILYPFSVQLNVGGISTNSFLDFGMGGQIEGNICYINKLIVQYVDCFPKIGVKLVYRYFFTQKNMYLWGGGIYIEAHNKYETKVRCVPRVDIGLIQSNTIALPDRKDAMSPIDGLYFAVLFEPVVYYQLTSHWELYGSIGMQLMFLCLESKQQANQSKVDNSNGKPDNYHIGLGCRYVINPYTKRYFVLPPFKRESRVDLILGISSDSYKPEGSQKEKRYPMIDASLLWNFLLLRHFGLNLGIELGYNWCKKYKTEDYIHSGARELSLLGGGAILLGRFAFDLQGVLDLNPITVENQTKKKKWKDNISTRVGIQYKIFNKLFVKVNVKYPTKKLTLSSLDLKIGMSL